MAYVVGESAMAFAYRALPGRVRFGWGASADHLVEELEAAGATRILLVHAEAERELAERLARPLGDAVVGTFTDVRQHVPVDVAHAGRRAAAASGADWILAVGGGSTTGAAKAIALEAGVQIAAVPTTYAGSEMTPVWGMTEDGVKQTGRDMRVLPSLVVYDPELTTSLPAAVTGPSAFNAMAHCVASYTAPGANPITALVADEGIRALSAGVVRATHDPFGREGRELLLYGAHLAGSALAVAGSGLHHRICNVLGGRFDLPHAATHTIMLPQVLAFNEAATPAVATRIRFAVSAGLETFSAGAAQAVFELIESVGGPLSRGHRYATGAAPCCGGVGHRRASSGQPEAGVPRRRGLDPRGGIRGGEAARVPRGAWAAEAGRRRRRSRSSRRRRSTRRHEGTHR